MRGSVILFLEHSEACRGCSLTNGKEAASVLLSFLGQLGALLTWLLSDMRRCCSSAKRSLSLKQSPTNIHTPFRSIRPGSPSFSFPPSLSSLSSMSPEQQTTTPQASAKVSSLARRIHGWSWQAVRSVGRMMNPVIVRVLIPSLL